PGAGAPKARPAASDRWRAGGRIGGGRATSAGEGWAAVNRVVKLADTLVFPFIVTEHPPIPPQAPSQPARPQAVAGPAVRVTCVPAAKLALQVEPQSIPAGELVTLPPGLPTSETE